MPKVDTFACAVCGTLRKETNHWFIVVPYTNLITFCPFTDFSWAEYTRASTPVEVVCGVEHGQQLLGRWMATGKISK